MLTELLVECAALRNAHPLPRSNWPLLCVIAGNNHIVGTLLGYYSGWDLFRNRFPRLVLYLLLGISHVANLL
jgi:hypothetical protein